MQLAKVYFTREEVKSRYHIKIHGYVHNDSFTLISDITGVEKTFTVDLDLTTANAQAHEYWDGEESHRLYTSPEAPDVICEIWHTPYDRREIL